MSYSSVAGSALDRGRRRVRGWTRRRPNRRILIAVLASVVVAELGMVGYLVGSSSTAQAPQADAVRRQAFVNSFDDARAAAVARARERGRAAGQRAGELAGELAGARIGARRGSTAVERREAAIAKQQAIEAAAALAAERRAARRQRRLAPADPAPPETFQPAPAVSPAPAPAPTSVPAPDPAAPAPDPAPPCFDSSGHPC